MGLYLVASFKGANLFTKLAFIFLSCAMFVGWISYCTASWGRGDYQMDNDYTGWGVWRKASNNDLRAGKSPNFNNGPLPTKYGHTDGWLLEWYGAFQAFATFGFICLNVGFLLVVLFTFVAPCKANADLAFWNAINNILGSVCWLIAIILFGARFDKKFDITDYDEHTLHYSFGLAIITFALQLAAGIVLLLTNRGGGAVQSAK